MPYFKVSYIFNRGRLGWSESWHIQENDSKSAIEFAKENVPYRKKLLGSYAHLEGIRVSDVAVVGDARTYTGPELFEDTENKVNDVTDPPWSSILCRARAQDNNARQVWIRGVPDNVIKFDQVNERWIWQDTDYQKLFKAWASHCTRNPAFLIRGTERNTGATAAIAVRDFICTQANQVIITTAADHSFQVGHQVRLLHFRARLLRVGRGPYYVLSTNGNREFTVLVPGADIFPLFSPKNARVTRHIIGYFPITELTMERAAKKSTGRAFFVSPGRRPAR